jgi:hypothetical protein
MKRPENSRDAASLASPPQRNPRTPAYANAERSPIAIRRGQGSDVAGSTRAWESQLPSAFAKQDVLNRAPLGMDLVRAWESSLGRRGLYLATFFAPPTKPIMARASLGTGRSRARSHRIVKSTRLILPIRRQPFWLLPWPLPIALS